MPITDQKNLYDGHFDHLDRCDWVVVGITSNVVDVVHDLLPLNHLAKHWVLGRPLRSVPPVEETVVGSVEEKLGSTRVWLSSVSHRERHGLVLNLGALVRSPEFIRDRSLCVPSDLLAGANDSVGATSVGAAGPCASTLGIL